MPLTKKASEEVRRNNKCVGRLMAHFNRSQRTIENWLDANDTRFTTQEALEIIKSETGLFDDDILEPVELQS